MLNLFDYETAAQGNLSEMMWGFYAGGAWDELTVRENRAAFARVWLRPHVLNDVSQRDLRTTVLGQPVAFPIGISPSAFHCLAHKDGERATARAAAKLGTLMALSTFSNFSMESVMEAMSDARREANASASAPAPAWFQLYPLKDRGLLQALVERAHAAHYSAICVTVDTPFSGRRERDVRNPLKPPPNMALGNFSAEALKMDTSSLILYVTGQVDPAFSWPDIAWLRSITPLPIVLKGVLRGDDATKAVEHGVAGLLVSNHGGRQLDGALATLRALPDVVNAVQGRAEVYLDGGVRRGTDVLKALALGARCVLLGRPVVWGLAVAGEAGVRHVLEMLRDELSLAMALAGCAALGDVDRSMIAAQESKMESPYDVH